jgi:thiazole/oxazole-forming peptide maturase SagC family component
VFQDLAGGAVRLSSTARLIEDGGGRLRIRTGVWNYEEAAIDVSGESPAVARTVRSALHAVSGGPMVLAEHLDPELLPIERANVQKLFFDLTQAGLLEPVGQRASQDAVTAALLGRLNTPYPGAPVLEREVLFLSDSAAATAQAERLAQDLRLPLTRMPMETERLLAESDLTTRIDGYTTEALITRLRAELAEPAAIVTCLQRPSLPLLRNLNRVLEGQDMPWVCGLVDGPFITVAGLKSPHTGCFECFEQRALARLEDHVTYHEFARSPIGQPGGSDLDAPMLTWLTVLAVTEGYLHASVNTSRLSGRVLGIHLPTLEIQTQDLLRLPSCPACGRVSRQRVREINFNSRAAVDRIISEVLQ